MNDVVIPKVLEKWQSAIKGHRWVNKFDPANPGTIMSERVRAGRSFYITPEERNLLNSDRIVDEKNDPFKNGAFRPLKQNAMEEARAVEAAIADQAASEAKPNPNHMSDEELGALFDISNFQAFKKEVSEITSKAVLTRLLNLSKDEKYEATVAKINLIKTLIGDDDTEGSSEGVSEVEQVSQVGFAEDRGTGLQPFKI